MQTATDCRCAGTGTYTVPVPLADAVVLAERLCPEHPPPADRRLARDERDGHQGEVVAYSREQGAIGRVILVWLRAVGGGIEHPVGPEHVRLVRDEET